LVDTLVDVGARRVRSEAMYADGIAELNQHMSAIAAQETLFKARQAIDESRPDEGKRLFEAVVASRGVNFLSPDDIAAYAVLVADEDPVRARELTRQAESRLVADIPKKRELDHEGMEIAERTLRTEGWRDVARSFATLADPDGAARALREAWQVGGPGDRVALVDDAEHAPEFERVRAAPEFRRLIQELRHAEDAS
jgi:hypothetical protein